MTKRGNPATLQPAEPMGSVALAKNPLSVKLEPEVDAAIRSLPSVERSVWMRRVLTEAAQKELMKQTGTELIIMDEN